MNFDGQRVTVMGLGTRGGGVGVARFFAEHGATVTVTDGKTEADLAEPMAELAGLPIRYVLGEHQERDFIPEGADLVIRNPGVRRTSPWLALARERGVPIEMEMSLFLRLCPAPVIGITGTKGKTTTATLCGQMLTAWNSRTVIAGNMGVSALKFLPEITPRTPVVIEISNWQLEALAEHQLSPAIAVLTNISEDHLDTYNGFADYAATKRGIARFQQATETFVVNADDPETWQATSMTAARILPFGHGERATPGAWFEGGAITLRDETRQETVAVPDAIRASGDHLLANAAAAAAAAWAHGAPVAAIEQGLRDFDGVKDRNERVAEIDGVTFVNDTAATTPVATVAALRAYAGRPVHLICGGSDKKVDLAPLAAAAGDAAGIYLLNGTATPRLIELLTAACVPYQGPFDAMAPAVESAALAAQPGSVVLLSPGCASFGLFRDEFHRGEQFRQAVGRLRNGRGGAA